MKKLRKLVLTMMVVCLFGSMAACGNRNGNEENTTENGAGSNNTTIRITQMTRIIVTIPQTMEIMAMVW